MDGRGWRGPGIGWARAACACLVVRAWHAGRCIGGVLSCAASCLEASVTFTSPSPARGSPSSLPSPCHFIHRLCLRAFSDRRLCASFTLSGNPPFFPSHPRLRRPYSTAHQVRPLALHHDRALPFRSASR